jgi:predicted naringenin-chalcone synthase
MSSAACPHIWERIIGDETIKPGTKVLSLGFGPGLTVAGMIMEKV